MFLKLAHIKLDVFITGKDLETQTGDLIIKTFKILSKMIAP
jgi:hypothetical protein